MKKHSTLSLILAALICLSSLVMSASALIMGDIDGNGKPDSGDARTALRASVGLEALTGKQFTLADMDSSGKIESSDAREILRTAVGLVKQKELPEEEPVPDTHPENHIFNTISMTGETKCAYKDCTATLPSFNNIVNTLKTTDNGVNRFTKIAEQISEEFPEFKNEWEFFAWMANPKTEKHTVYNGVEENRYLTKNNFYSQGQSFVSDLKDSDVASKTIETVSTVDFAKELPDTFKVKDKTFSTKQAKAKTYNTLYKITLTVKDPTYNLKDEKSYTSALDKIYYKDFFGTFIQPVKTELKTEFGDYMKYIEGTVTPSITVTYYVDAVTLVPVAAKYSCDMKIEMAFFEIKLPTSFTDNSYIFFNPDFTLAG